MNFGSYRNAGLSVVCVLMLLTATNKQVDASLIFQLNGVAGSNLVEYRAFGSLRVTQMTERASSGIALAPVSGKWSGSFDNNLGNFLRDDMDTSFNDNLVLSHGGISYRINGVEFGVLDLLDLDGSMTNGGDDVELDPSTTVFYPELLVGDTISWAGRGNFLLEAGETFDSLFTQTGKFSNSLDGGSYDVVISEKTFMIPAPGSFFIFAGIGASWLWRRGRRT